MMTWGGGGGGAVAPMPPYSYDPRYGGKPQVPDPGASAGSAIGANLGNWGALSSLIGKANALSASTALDALRKNMPNYDALANARSTVLGSFLGGQVPADVITQLINRAAERGIFTGSPGSPNSNASYLRALGLTSLDLMGKGLTGFSQAIHDTPVGTQMRPESMMITPDAVQQARMMANYYAAMPDPSAAAQVGMYDTPKFGGFNSNIGPVRLGGGGPSSPYSNPPPDYSYNPSMGGIGQSNISTASPTGRSYWGADLFQPGGPNLYQQPGAWGAPSGTWYNPIGDTYNNPNPGGFDASTPWFDWQNYAPTGMDYGPPTPPYQDYGPTGMDYGPASPDYGPVQTGYDPILDASTNGPGWWNSISGGDGYYPFAGADLGLGTGGWGGGY